MSDIRDTTAAMNNDPAEALLFLAESMATGTPGPTITRQEAAGQREMLTAAAIPTRTMGCTDQDLLDLGFTLGPPRHGDPLFRDATLPAGWTRAAVDDTGLATYLLDPLGRPRCSVFYKAAFYDRDAHITILSVPAYVSQCIDRRQPPVLDEVWATRDRVLAALDDRAATAAERIEFWQGHGRADRAEEHQEQTAACAWVRAQLAEEPRPSRPPAPVRRQPKRLSRRARWRRS